MATQAAMAVRPAEHASVRTVAGLSALAFAGIVGTQNVVRVAIGTPQNDATGAEVASFFAANAPLLSAGISSVPVAMVAILTFVSTITHLTSQGPRDAAVWSRLGMLAGVFLAASFSVGAVFEVTLVLLANELVQQPATAALVWKLHAAAFPFSALTLAVTLFSLARACHLSGITAGWQFPFATVAAAGLLITGTATVPVAAGLPLIYPGFLGFIGWLMWLAATGVRLLRS